MEKRTIIVLVLAALAVGIAAVVGAGNRDKSSSSTSTDSIAQTQPATTSTQQVETPAAIAKQPVMPKTSGTPPKAMETKDLVNGSGKAAAADSTVTVRYTGTLWGSGKVFDSSWTRNPNTIDFPLSGVIKCWQTGIVGMKVGGRRELVCPPDVAYGEQGNGGVPPNATLIFVVDLLNVTP